MNFGRDGRPIFPTGPFDPVNRPAPADPMPSIRPPDPRPIGNEAADVAVNYLQKTIKDDSLDHKHRMKAAKLLLKWESGR